MSAVQRESVRRSIAAPVAVPLWYARDWLRCHLRLHRVHRHRTSGPRTVQRVARSLWSHYAILRGRLVLTVRERQVALAAGDGCIVPPGAAFAERVESDPRGVSAVICEFSSWTPPEASDPLTRLGLPRAVPARDGAGFRERELLLLRCASQGRLRSTEAALHARCLLDQVLTTHVIDGFAADIFAVSAHDEMPPWLASLVDRLGRRIKDPDFSFGELVATSGFSRTHLIAQCSRYLGFTPMDYVRRMRITLAGQTLRRDRELSVAQIAGMCGYRDASLFTRHFRALMGTTPTRWRDGRERTVWRA